MCADQVFVHGELQEILPEVFFVTGSLRMPGRLPIRFSRNMTVLRQGRELTLINSVRLNDSGLASLDALGKVTHVVRLAGFHGMDDPFYKAHYGARIWAIEGQRYSRGFDPQGDAGKAFFEADMALNATSELPVETGSLYLFSCRPPEGLLLISHDSGNVLISGDCLQNWATADPYFNLPARLMMRAMGFIKPCNIGPGWLKYAKPAGEELLGLLDLAFEHVLPAHGAPVIGGAKEAFRPAITRAGG